MDNPILYSVQPTMYLQHSPSLNTTQSYTGPGDDDLAPPNKSTLAWSSSFSSLTLYEQDSLTVSLSLSLPLSLFIFPLSCVHCTRELFGNVNSCFQIILFSLSQLSPSLPHPLPLPPSLTKLLSFLVLASKSCKSFSAATSNGVCTGVHVFSTNLLYNNTISHLM